MTEQVMTSGRKLLRIESVIKVFEFSLPLTAVILACCVGIYTQRPIPIAKPVILLLGSLFTLVSLKSETSTTLQKIIGIYLSSVVINQLSSQYFSFSFLRIDLSVSYGVVILLLCAIGYILGRLNSTNKLQSVEWPNITYDWVFALTIIVVHMLLLSLILSRFYGYGYERNLSVLGNLCLYFLLFIVLWEKFSLLRFRQIIGLILTLFNLAMIIVNR